PTMPSPQLASLQLPRQVSVSMLLASSHCSPAWTIPSPQNCGTQTPPTQLSVSSLQMPSSHGQPSSPGEHPGSSVSESTSVSSSLSSSLSPLSPVSVPGSTQTSSTPTKPSGQNDPPTHGDPSLAVTASSVHATNRPTINRPVRP